ncbi:MAG: hypothetical protein P9E24_07160 [Candidatus Competibacter sp.]|nr:hypothetical protein [Candidatus Competibacter sp.]MDG4584805.1 hypothetical protein [Candidatus Competibacter sp.]
MNGVSVYGGLKRALWRNIILPVIYALRQEPVTRELALLERTQWIEPNQLKAIQREKLYKLLKHSRKNISFYKDRVPADIFSQDDIDPLDLLAKIPILEKQDVRCLARETAKRLKVLDRYVIRRTAGTSGHPLLVYADSFANACSLAARARCLGWFGVRIGDRECRIWGRPLSHFDKLKASFKDMMLNRIRVSIGDLEPMRIASTALKILLNKPDYLYGYASIILQFGENFSELKGNANSSLKAVVLTADASNQHQRDRLAKTLGCPVVDEFGCSEVDIIAHQCPAGSYHIIAENVLLEIVPQADGNPNRGEVLLTDLNNTLMPLIRYRLGDEVVLRQGICSCGRTLPMISSVTGRVLHQYFYLPNGRRVHSYLFEYFIDDLVGTGVGIKQFQVKQVTFNQIVINLVLEEDIESNRGLVYDFLQKRLLEEIGGGVKMQVRFHKQLVPKPGIKFECFQPFFEA